MWGFLLHVIVWYATNSVGVDRLQLTLYVVESIFYLIIAWVYYIGHCMCHWNGLWRRLLERHPFLAKVIEMVVNHTRNRFTTVAYDHIFCPNPFLALLREDDDLFNMTITHHIYHQLL